MTNPLERYLAEKARIEKLERDNEKMREALEFYANPENWTRRDSVFHESIDRDDCKDYPHITREIRLTGGHRARRVLAEIKGE